MDKNGISNKQGVEKARLELASAMTKVIVNEALAKVKAAKQAKENGAQPASILH
jgi:hypothetical protein